MVSATSTASGTSREERQQAQLDANRAAAEAAEKSANQPGGGINQPKYSAPRGGPTWADTPAGRALRQEYERSGVVFDSGGNIIYNPADLGAAEVERARAAAGEPPSSKVRGEISQSYAASVYTQSRRTQSATRSGIEQLNTQKANAQAAIAEAKANIERAKAQKNSILSSSTSSETLNMAASQDALIRGQEAVINKYQNQISRIDSARTTLAKQEQAANKDIAMSALSLGASRATSGPVDTGSFSSSRNPTISNAETTPQRQRPKALSGVQEKLFANPDFMQNAENYTRPALFTNDVRRERPKALQGVTEKLFANPKYVTKGQQRDIDKRAAFSLSLTENINTSKGPQSFAISLSEGAPAEPRKITQEQFDAMTPQQQALYNAEVSAYNQYAINYNREQKQKAKEAREQNVLQWKQAKSELLVDIANLKKQGVTTISALTTQGSKDIPINNAFKALSSGEVGGAKILGLGIAPNIPEGYTVVDLTSRTLMPSKETAQKLLREEQRKQIERDPTGLSKFIFKEEMATEKGSPIYGPSQPGFLTELQRSGAQYYSLVSSNIGSFVNLAYAGSSMFYKALGVKKLEIAYEKIPRVYQGKQTGGEMIFSALTAAASEAVKEGNATRFVPTLQKEATAGATTLLKAPIGAIVGQGAGLFALFGAPLPGKGLARLLPIKYTSVILPTGKSAAERTASVFTFGYNPKTSKYVGGFLGWEEKLKPFVGTPPWAKMGLERVTPPTGSSFDVYEFAAYNKQQSKPIYDLFRYGEKTGAVKPGTIEQQTLENTERAKQSKMKVKYETTLPVQIEGIPLRPSEMQSMQQAVSVIQKKGYTDPGKGSLIQNMLSGWPKRAQGDLLDLEIKIPKNTEKIMKDVENLRYRAAQAAEKGDYEKQQKLLAKADKREAKVYEKGEAAVDYILSNVKMEPGRALGRKGFNIVVGEADGIPKVAEQSDLILYHGTSPRSAQKILRSGFDFTKSRTSESTIFTSTDTRGAYGISGVTLEIKMRPSAKILDVNKEGMAQWEDIRIREYAKKNNYDLIKNLMQGQQLHGEEIEVVSAKNILSIKPTKSSIPKTIYDVPTGRYIKNNIRTISGEWINPTAKMSMPTQSLFRNRPFTKSDYKQFLPGLKKQAKSILSDEGLTYYHGTKTPIQKQKILQEGPIIPDETGFFLSPKKTGYFSASEFGKELVEVKIKPDAKILRVGDDFLVEGKEIDDILEEAGIEFAKSKGYQGIDRPISIMRGGEGERELILFSKEPIQGITDVSRTSNKLEFHHIVKGGEKKYGVPLTFEEHKGITALQGQLGKIPYIRGQEKALSLLGERGQYSGDINKRLVKLTPSEKTEIRTTLLKASEEATKLERPTIKKGTKKEVLNMIGPREQLKDKIGEALGNVDRPFGEKWPKSTTKFRVKDESGQVVTYKIGYQSMAKFKAISGIQSAESIAGDFSHTQEWKDKLLGGARLVKSPKTFRYEKDPLDAYMLTYRNIKYQYDRGDIAGARESVQAALGMRKYYTGYDFLKGAKTFKSVSNIEVPRQPKRSVTDTAVALSGRAAATGTRFASPINISPRQKEKSPITSPIQTKSVKSVTSAGSVLSARSGLVSASSSAMSPGLSARQSSLSTRMTSAKPSARPSPRSPRFSTASPKSISSPKPSAFSPLSPSAKSPTSPSPYGSSPLSPSPRLTPSPTLSPLYPIEPKPVKPIIPPSPRIGFMPPRIKNTTDKTRLSKKDQLEFFGSTHAASVLGFRSKKKDFDYGKDLGSLAVKDIRTTDPLKKSPLTKKKSGMILSSPKRYFTPTKKQSKNFLKIRL